MALNRNALDILFWTNSNDAIEGNTVTYLMLP